MATKDYVRRPQKRKNKAAQKQPVSWLRIGIAMLLIAMFIFALYSLQKTSVESPDGSAQQQGSDQPENNQDVSLEEEIESDSENNKNAQSSPEAIGDVPETLAPLPVLGEEDWAYIDSLPEFSVEVDATGPVQSDKEYIMQCGSFRTNDRAEELKAKIAFQGYESRIIASDGSNGRWYRVVLGPYQSKRNAEKDRHQLRSGNVNGCKIW